MVMIKDGGEDPREEAIEACTCFDAQRHVRIKKQKKKTRENIELLIGEKCPDEMMTDIVVLAYNAGDLVCEEYMDKVTPDRAGNRNDLSQPEGHCQSKSGIEAAAVAGGIDRRGENMYTPRILYDVYDGEKKVLHLARTEAVMKLTGVRQGTVYKAVTTGYLIHGRYRVEEAWAYEGREYTERETETGSGMKTTTSGEP